MKIGYCEDWTGGATIKIEIIDETISGKYLCQQAPFELMRPDGTKYLTHSLTGLFLRDKAKVKDIRGE